MNISSTFKIDSMSVPCEANETTTRSRTIILGMPPAVAEWSWLLIAVAAAVVISEILIRATRAALLARLVKRRMQQQQVVAANGVEQHRYLARLPSARGRLPWLGHLLQLLRSGHLPHRWLHSLAKRQPGLVLLWLGPFPTLLVSSPSDARLILHNHDLDFASRPKTYASSRLLYGASELAFASHGPYWRKMKGVYMTNLLNASRLREFMPVRADELSRCLNAMWRDRGSPREIRTKLFHLAFNVYSRMILGKSARDFESIQGGGDAHFMSLLGDASRLMGAVNIADFLPCLRRLDLQGLQRQIDDTHKKLDAVLQSLLDGILYEKRKAGSIAMSNSGSSSSSVATPPTILDALLEDLEIESDVESSSSGYAADRIKSVILELFIAGTETTVTIVEWGMSELIRNRDVMKELQQELDNVVGRERVMQESDIPKLPFLQAVVKENLRLHPSTSMLPPHETKEAREVAGFHVDGGTRAIVNTWAIARDETFWEKPLQFMPSRFLNSSVDVKGHHFQLLPFGAGRRACPAMNLGLVTTQLLLGAFVHSFDWTLPPNMWDVDMREKYALSLQKVVPLVAVVTPRLPDHVLQQ